MTVDYRDRGRARPLDHEPLTAEERERVERYRAIYDFEVKFPELAGRPARRIIGHWLMLRLVAQRDRHLLTDAAGALLGFLGAALWLVRP